MLQLQDFLGMDSENFPHLVGLAVTYCSKKKRKLLGNQNWKGYIIRTSRFSFTLRRRMFAL